MKPKHRVMCPECFRQKMLFETQKQADNFIKWNGESIDTHGGELRAYYCQSCGGWHISSKPFKKSYEHNTENLIRRFKETVKFDSFNAKFVKLKDPVVIYNEIPEDVIKQGKKAIRKYLTEYFELKGIEDKSGALRSKIYKIYDERK